MVAFIRSVLIFFGVTPWYRIDEENKVKECAICIESETEVDKNQILLTVLEPTCENTLRDELLRKVMLHGPKKDENYYTSSRNKPDRVQLLCGHQTISHCVFTEMDSTKRHMPRMQSKCGHRKTTSFHILLLAIVYCFYLQYLIVTGSMNTSASFYSSTQMLRR